MMMISTIHTRHFVQNAETQWQLEQRLRSCYPCCRADAAFLTTGTCTLTRPPDNRVATLLPTTKFYRGDAGGMVYVVSKIGGQTCSCPLRHVVNHSSVEFAWGYEGSGPVDLAMSMLCDVLGEWPNPTQLRYGWFRASAYCKAFKCEFITRWRLGEPFEIPAESILAWLRMNGAEV